MKKAEENGNDAPSGDTVFMALVSRGVWKAIPDLGERLCQLLRGPKDSAELIRGIASG